MAFWSTPDNDNQIRHKYAFKVEIEELNYYKIYYAKSVDKPSVTVKPVTLKYLFSHEVKFPGRPTWNPIRLTLYNIGPRGRNRFKDLAGNVHDILESNGYNPPTIGSSVPPVEEDNGDWFVNKFIFKDDYKLKGVKIHQLDTSGGEVETWSLANPFIIDFKYDTLDYAQEGPTMIDLTLAYDWATLT